MTISSSRIRIAYAVLYVSVVVYLYLILILFIIPIYLYNSNMFSACNINDPGKRFIINIPLKYYYNILAYIVYYYVNKKTEPVSCVLFFQEMTSYILQKTTSNFSEKTKQRIKKNERSVLMYLIKNVFAGRKVLT